MHYVLCAAVHSSSRTHVLLALTVLMNLAFSHALCALKSTIHVDEFRLFPMTFVLFHVFHVLSTAICSL